MQNPPPNQQGQGYGNQYSTPPNTPLSGRLEEGLMTRPGSGWRQIWLRHWAILSA